MPPRTKTIAELKRELAAKERQLDKLQADRKKLQRQLDVIDRQIVAMGGEAPAAPARRGRRKAARKTTKAARKAGKAARRGRRTTGKPLAEYIQKVLAGGEPMRAKHITAAVKKAGYKSGAKDFYGIVAATLRDEKLFKRVSRGVYTLAK